MNCDVGLNEADGAAVPAPKSQTVGEMLDRQILECRERLERACVKKAKAECLNILDHPADFYESLGYSF